MSSPRLKWLRIHRYRNVVPGAFIEFNDGFNVLLGRNGTGKTTLLELIEMLWTRGFGRIADEEFHLECEVEFDPEPFRAVDHASGESRPAETPRFILRAVIENVITGRSDDTWSSRDVGAPVEFKYRVALLDVGGLEMLRTEGSPLGATVTLGALSWAVPVLDVHSWPVLWSGPQQLFRPSTTLSHAEWERVTEDPVNDVAALCSWMLATAPSSVARFDESLAAFHALTDKQYGSQDRGVEGVSWSLRRSLSGKRQVYPIAKPGFRFTPVSLVRYCHAAFGESITGEPLEARVPHSSLPLLDQFVRMTGYTGAWVDVRPDEIRRRTNTEDLFFRGPDFRFTLPGDRGDIPAHALSYGEKRLLSFLWYLDCGSNAVIADELVNGFHHEWIERCIELIGDRQAFLASQNPLLLDSLPLGDVEYIRKCFITCRRGPDTEGQMQWANLSHEEAADFSRAYERGTRYVHEILRGKGLW